MVTVRAAKAPAARQAAIRPNHTRCRICDSGLPEPFLDLGAMPLANAFLDSRDPAADEPRFPLAVSACGRCGLVQLNHVVPAEQLYRNYIYVSSTSEGVRRHAAWLARLTRERYERAASERIVEIASNDGTVLKAFQAEGFTVLGVEPARNIAAIAEADGVPTLPEFFGEQSASAIRENSGVADYILGRHVFAHVDDLHDFMRGVDRLLAPKGVLMIEVPYLGTLIEQLEFDTIYHEHLSYFALSPVAELAHAHGFQLFDADTVDLHGGSVILHFRRWNSGGTPSDRLQRLFEDEAVRGLTRPENLSAFGERVRGWRQDWLECIRTLSDRGHRLLGYGAAAKGNTLLNYCPEAADRLIAVLDRSPHKQGKHTPGTRLPVLPPESWKSLHATHMVILAWNFKEEIIRQMRPFADAGGRFIVPVPRPEVI